MEIGMEVIKFYCANCGCNFAVEKEYTRRNEEPDCPFCDSNDVYWSKQMTLV